MNEQNWNAEFLYIVDRGNIAGFESRDLLGATHCHVTEKMPGKFHDTALVVDRNGPEIREAGLGGNCFDALVDCGGLNGDCGAHRRAENSDRSRSDALLLEKIDCSGDIVFLIVSVREHGESEGLYCTYRYYEKYDCSGDIVFLIVSVRAIQSLAFAVFP